MDVTAYTSPADAALMGKTVLLGLGVVFVGLVCIIALCFVMSRLVRSFGKKTVPVETAPAAPVVTEDRGALSAVIAAAIAEELGTDIGGIRIVSIKKI